MKRLAFVSIAVLALLLMGCEGDDPSGPGGTLATVTGVSINWGASSGVDIVVDWTAVADVEGYRVYFRETSGGTWTEVGEVATTTYTHTASVAGYYAVLAYDGDDVSEDYGISSNNSLPNIISTQYTIYDQYAPGTYHSGFIFHFTSGETGLAGEASFVQDMFAYDFSDKGDADIGLASGTYGTTYPDGNPTWFIDNGTVYGNCPAYPTDWWEWGQLIPSDDVLFGYLHDGYYVKLYIDSIDPESTTNNGTGVTIHFEFQEHAGIRLFTSDSS